ncbi:MAG: DUF4080 domain-containing protein [Gammaproteobacteria bacterium]|nr:DUF4080 domain-containing protein [Gammaproteobacteria bacterium]
MTPIILSTLNARFIHCALGLRYLYANLQELQAQASIVEFTIDNRPIDIVEKLLKLQPRIIGLGVYIWNAEQTTYVVALLKKLSPQTIVVLGGPEVSFEHGQQPIIALADYVINGAADLEFYRLCADILGGEDASVCGPREKIIQPREFQLSEISLPYTYYSKLDIANRVIYVEASRGCPFKCEFCLSALDKTAWPFDLELFLGEMQKLYDRGVRQFKFVDRTFNLKTATTTRILEFFLQRLDKDLFLHFELIPDHLPQALKELIRRFPEHSLQFEIGIQTFNPEVQRIISRKQDNDKAMDNIRWLREKTHAHLHTDLIAGLPGEDINSFAKGFNQLIALQPHEIQVGILKRLRGAPIIRHTDAYHMVYNPNPPYNVLSTKDIDFATMQSLSRFARYWDLIANSGRFNETLPLILGDDAFNRFMKLSNWLYAVTEQTHAIALSRLFQLIHDALTTEFALGRDIVVDALTKDLNRSNMKGAPGFLNNPHQPQEAGKDPLRKRTQRQTRHRNNPG